MNKNKIIYGLAFALLVGTGCSKDGISDDLSFLTTAPAVNADKVFHISDDNSGNVRITPVAQGASSFVVVYGHGTGSSASAVVMPGGSTTHAYPEGSYTVSITAKDISGRETTNTYPLQVTYRAPEDIEITAEDNVYVLKVKAKAKYASSFLVYFGDVANETGTPLAAGGEATHTYADAGSYDVRVVALSGGAAQSEESTPVRIYDPFGFPITFDDVDQDYFFGTFGGGQGFAVVDNPNPSGINTSAKVGQFTRGWEGWSGTYSPLNTPMNLATGKIVRVWAYNPEPALVGKQLNVELEAGSVPNGVAVAKTAFTTSGAWEELVFDFSGNAAIPADATFSQLVLRFNDSYEGGGVGGQGTAIYVDNFRLTN